MPIFKSKIWPTPLTPAIGAVLAGAAVYSYLRANRSGRPELSERNTNPFSGDSNHATNVDQPLPSTPLERRYGSRASDGRSTRDVVEEASWESFPASDPPAW